MKLAAAIARSLQTDMQAELRELEGAVAAGARDAGRSLKTELRRQVASAGLGQRLANSWRDKHYPLAGAGVVVCLMGYGRMFGKGSRCDRTLTAYAPIRSP